MVGSNAAAHSMSTFSIKELHGSHMLTVNGYTKTKELAVGEFWRSAVFPVAGHRWSIKYYPNGDTPENAGYVSFYLRLVETNAPDVKARFGFSLLDTRGKPVPSYCHDSSSIKTFSVKGTRSNGWDRFIKRNTLEQHQPAFPLRRHVQGQAELFGPARPSGEVCVWVDGIEVDVLKAMLHFVYTDSLPEVVEEDGAGGEAKKTTTMMKKAMAQGLLAAADRYGLERLKLMCEDKLCDGIETSSVGTLLALAEKHGCEGLKKGCLDFLHVR
ncbi:hypothetical protein HU200_044059 [Digitaria exilis]|uniref:MATH domain-containing protein n=1 Tax=Digitaria exilis TaxID=1010633 RepID=A0A835B3G7_9POAL|nr:hypothetical protein HU200_044059 [Digitaria exilis]